MKPVRTYVYRKKHRSGNVTWVVRWKHPDTGQWFNISSAKSRDEADELNDSVRSSLRKGLIPQPERQTATAMTVGVLIDLYMKSPRFQNALPSWCLNQRGQLDRVIRPALGALHL